MTSPPLRQLAPLGNIEPHALLLRAPSDEQWLYKVMTVENLLRSLAGNYLHFNRVDSYSDCLNFPNADKNDGRQLLKDRPANAAVNFEKTPDFSAAHYYDQCRSRTYSCCFSIENSDYIWNNYANGSEKGKVCVVFQFGKLRTMLNHTLSPERAVLLSEDSPCRQIFSVNYGLIDYVDWDSHRINEERLPNPILYSYLKDANRFDQERELRISLSAIGVGDFALKNNTLIQFSPNLQVGFDFREAIANSTIREIMFSPGTDSVFLTHELSKLRIESAQMAESGVNF